MSETLFRFKQFHVNQENCGMKINTDGVLLGAWCDVDDATSALDIGTGSGVIALMLAQRSNAEEIIGVEIDSSASQEAARNMKSSIWANHLSAVNSSIQDFSDSSEKTFDLIVSNPPFFSGGTLSSTQKRTNVKHTVKLGHSDLLRACYKLLTKKGRFSVVLPHLEGLRFIELAEQSRLYCTRKCEVTSFPGSTTERLLLEFSKTNAKTENDTIAIRDLEGNYSNSYIELTKAFYLKM